MPDSVGSLMNPMQPPARNPMPQGTMVAPAAPPQAAMPPPPPPAAPPQGVPPPGMGMPPGGMPPMQPQMSTPPMGANPMSSIMPKQMPDIIQLLLNQGMQNGLMNRDMPSPQIAPTPGLQSAPLRGTTESIGGR